MKLKNVIHHFHKLLDVPLMPEDAYNIWANSYDRQDKNLVFKLEKEILDSFFRKLNLEDKIILDYGCGTGRNWERLIPQKPKSLTGCDVSSNMLEKLKQKFPLYETYLIKGASSLSFQESSFDFILSTLVIAQIKNIKKTFSFWNEWLKPGGNIIITDMHPKILQSGGKRTFQDSGKSFEVKNYIHTIDEVMELCRIFKWEVIETEEKLITEEEKDFYAEKKSIHVYEKFYGLPLVYGMLIRK